MIAEEFLERLEGVTGNGRSCMALCPAHEDHNPSLSITEEEDRILVKCHAGCNTEEVVAALGLTMSDLYHEKLPPERWTQADANVALAARGLHPKTVEHFGITADLQRQAWMYLLDNGSVRYKAFDSTRNGRRYWVAQGTKPGTYNLEACRGQEVAYLVEGEPDVWTMHQAGLPAFSFTNGAGTIPEDAVEQIKAAAIGAIQIIYDNDETGSRGAAKAEQALRANGINCTVKLLPESVGPSGDVTTLYCQLKHDDAGFRSAVADLETAPAARRGEASGGNAPLVASVANVAPSGRRWPDPPHEDVFHGLPGDIVRTIKPHSEADPMAILAQTLVAFGNVVGRGPHVLVEADHHYTNLYANLVGPTGMGRKGTAWGRVQRLFQGVDRQWLSDRKQTGLSSGEGLIHAVRDPFGEDEGVADKRLLVMEPEFASTLRVMSRDGNILSPVMREGWDTGDLRVLTKNSPTKATGAHISIIGHITDDEFRRYLNRTEAGNGFGNRILIFCVRRSQCLPFGGDLDEAACAPLVGKLQEAVTFARGVGRIHFDDDAKKLWCEVYPALSEGAPGLLGAMTGRAEAQTIRIAAIYALLDKSAVILRPHLQAALAVWRYAEDSVRHVFGDALGDPVADEILAALRSTPEGLSRTDIRNLFSRHGERERINTALANLEAHGLARCEPRETGGRPKEVWVATKATKATKGAAA